MNTINLTANSINAVPSAAAVPLQTSTIIKTSQQHTQNLQQSNIVVPTTIINTSNNTNSNISQQQTTSIQQLHQNHESIQSSTPQQSVTAFTIHTTPTQSLQTTTIPNNLMNAAAGSANVGPNSAVSTVQAQSIQTINSANASIIHSATITGITGGVNTSGSVVATILPSCSPAGGGQQVTAIPVGVPCGGTTTTLLKTQPIGQRFQTAPNVMTSTGPPNQSGPINTLFIHRHQAHNVNYKNANVVAHSVTTNHHPTSHLQNSSMAKPTAILQPISTHNPASTPLFIQTSGGRNSQTPNSAIFHQTNVAATVANIFHNSSPQQHSTNLHTIDLSTSPVLTRERSPSPPFQKLKVEDALSYLDRVKLKFAEKPQIYNDFLDIMKEFKSQTIDTPSVIQRVSVLFKGNAELIVGFNTFLPPGYKIEINAHDQLNVSCPNSTNYLITNAPIPNALHHHHHQHHQQQQQQLSPSVVTPAIVTGQNLHQLHHHPSNLVRSNALISNQQNVHQPTVTAVLTNHHGFGITNQQASSMNSIQSRDTLSNMVPIHSSNNSSSKSMVNHNRIEPVSPSIHNHRSAPLTGVSLDGPTRNSTSTLTTTIHPAAHLSNQQQQQQQSSASSQSGPVEFNHAISYVNKIKNRFTDQPEIYKQFLDILQSYQKEQDNSGQKILTESEVFSKVSKLFENQPDLLQEFSQFLPDAHNSNCHSHHNSSMTSPHVSNNLLNSPQAANYQNQNPIANNYSGHLDGNSNQYLHHQSSNSIINANEYNSLKKSINVINCNTINNSVLTNRTSNIINSNNISNNNVTNSSFPNAFHRPNKRSISHNQSDHNNSHHMKRSKLTPSRDPNIPEAGLVEYAFFDKLRLALNLSNYDWLMRSMLLYYNEVLTQSEFAQIIQPLFASNPELYRRLKDMLGLKEGSMINSVLTNNQAHIYLDLYNKNCQSTLGNSSYSNSFSNSISQLDNLSNKISIGDRRDQEYVEVDLASCEKYGISYRTIPKSSCQQECSGRTPLCREVLNDTLVSFPSWSEDSQFVSSRKTQYEEYIYKCEDERFELDLTIEANYSTIRVLEAIQRKLENMTTEEKNAFKLNDCLGGSSQTIHINSIRRIYGENSIWIIEGIKNSPATVIPLVLRRLMVKNEEWRDAQKEFNRMWRDQNEKYYLKSLDHQGITFKQNDNKLLRGKSLLSEIENIAFAKKSRKFKRNQERNKRLPYKLASKPVTTLQGCFEQNMENFLSDADMILRYPDKSMIEVACNLIIHHVKRQTSVHNNEKIKIKNLIRSFIPDLFCTPRADVSDDDGSTSNNGSKIFRYIKGSKEDYFDDDYDQEEESDEEEDDEEAEDQEGSYIYDDADESDEPDEPYEVIDFDRVEYGNPKKRNGSDIFENSEDSDDSDSEEMLQIDEEMEPDDEVTVRKKANSYSSSLKNKEKEEESEEDEDEEEGDEEVEDQEDSDNPEDLDESYKPNKLVESKHEESDDHEKLSDSDDSEGSESNNSDFDELIQVDDDPIQQNDKETPEHGLETQYGEETEKNEEEYSLFFTNSHWYLFFRLHHLLCERLNKMHERAKQIAIEKLKSRECYKNNRPPAIALGLRNDIKDNGENYFEIMVEMTKQVLDGNLDANQFEDNLREMFSTHAYIAFTLDKVVQSVVRQLQHIVSDDVSRKCRELFLEAQELGLSSSPITEVEEQVYFEKFRLINDEDSFFRTVVYKDEVKIAIDMYEYKRPKKKKDKQESEDNANDERLKELDSFLIRKKGQFKRKSTFIRFLEKKLRKNPPFLKKYLKKEKGVENIDMSCAEDINDNNHSNLQFNEEKPKTNNNQEVSNDNHNMDTDEKDNCNINKQDNIGIKKNQLIQSSKKDNENRELVPNDDNDKMDVDENHHEKESTKDNNKKDRNDVNKDNKENYELNEKDVNSQPDENKNHSNNVYNKINNKEKKENDVDVHADDVCSKIIKKCDLTLSRYNSFLAVSNDRMMFRINEKAKMSHKDLCLAKYRRYNKWYSKWIQKNCTDIVQQKYDEWLIASDTTFFILKPKNDNSSTNNENNDGDNNTIKNNKKQQNESIENIESEPKSTSSQLNESANKTTSTAEEIEIKNDMEDVEEGASFSSNEKKSTNSSDSNDNDIKPFIIQKIKIECDMAAPYHTYYKYLRKSS